VWWVSYKGPDGLRRSESSGSSRKGDAQELLKRRVGAKANNLAVIPYAERLTFHDAVQAVIDDYETNGKRSLSVVRSRIDNHLMPFFGRHRLAGITASDVLAYIAARQKQGIVRERRGADGSATTERVRDLANASINRELEVLKRVFTLAMRAGKLATRPHIALLRTDNTRKGFFEAEQLAGVLAGLPQALAAVIEFGAITGWRVNSEVIPLQWRNVDFKAGEVRIDPHASKNGEPRTFPMTRELRRILEQQWREHERLEKAGTLWPDVFFKEVAEGRGGTKKPQPIGEFRKTWKQACLAAGCPGRIPHDLRRTAVRNLVRAGISERVAMAMTGHKTRSVFERYNVVSPGDFREAAGKLDLVASMSR
jgi:integrase